MDAEKLKKRREWFEENAPYGRKEDGSAIKYPPPKARGKLGRPVKVGRKKGQKSYSRAPIVQSVFMMMMFGAKKITNDINKKKGLKPLIPLNFAEACRETGQTPSNLLPHIRANPELNERYISLRKNRQEALKMVAEDNIEKGLGGTLDLSDKDLLDASFRFLEKTDKAYNPRIEVEQTTKNLNFNVPIEDLEKQLKEIISM